MSIEADLKGSVVAVHRSAEYTFSKKSVDAISLVAGLGVEGDVHNGATVKHRSRVARDPSQPNLRQVHLVMSELLDEVNAAGHAIEPGALGENITTAGIDLIALPLGAMLRIGDRAMIAITGLRNPCRQIEGFSEGLLKKMFVDRAPRTGVMGVVVGGGEVTVGDAIEVGVPPGRLIPLDIV